MNTTTISPQQVNYTKKEVSRLKRLKKRFEKEPEAVEDLNRLINRHIRYIETAQQKIDAEKIR